MNGRRQDDRPWNRLGSLVRAEQARVVDDHGELRGLEAAAGRPGTRAATVARRRRWPAMLAVGGLAAAGLAAVALFALRPRPLSFDAAGASNRAGVRLATEQQAMPLRFSDGSVLTLAASSEGEVADVSPHGATVRLYSGHLEAAVVHAAKTRWTVGVGPYVVHVTGTRFSASWDRARQRLRVALTAGGVTVQGPLLGAAGLPLRPGQALSVDVGAQRVSLAPLGDETMTATAATTPPPDVAPPPVTSPPLAVPVAAPAEWKRWALASDPARAYAAAAQIGIGPLCRQLSPTDLLLLADTARFAGAPRAAKQAFDALRARFPSDARAGDAVFGLGVLALDTNGQPGQAARRFQEYVARWPEGTLAREAQGRLIEALDRAARPDDARRAATRYLARYSDGPHAPLARRVLRRDRP